VTSLLAKPAFFPDI